MLARFRCRCGGQLGPVLTSHPVQFAVEIVIVPVGRLRPATTNSAFGISHTTRWISRSRSRLAPPPTSSKVSSRTTSKPDLSAGTGQVPGQQMRIVGQRVQVWGCLQ